VDYLNKNNGGNTMEKAIDLMVARKQDEKIQRYEEFNDLFLLLISYSPDQKTSNPLLGKVGNISEKLIQELDKSFFSDIYIKRNEENEIKLLLASRKVVFVVGYVGVGKTVTLRKIAQDLSEPSQNEAFIYVDINEIPGIHRLELDSLVNTLSDHVYKKVAALHPSGSEEEILTFDQYLYKDYVTASLKVRLRRKFGYIDEDNLEEWKKFWSISEFREELASQSLSNVQILEAYIRFFERYYKKRVIICFDNVDSYKRSGAKKVIELAEELRNTCAITVLVTLREYNIRRLLTEICEERGTDDNYSNLVLLDIFEKIPSRENYGYEFIRGFNQISFRELIERRLRFLQENSELEDIRKEIDSFLDQEGFSRKSEPVDFRRYRLEFWRIFTKITERFFEEHINLISNENIRDVQIRYIDFINSILLGPESDIIFNKIFWEENGNNRLTVNWHNLRNYLFRWALFEDHESLVTGKLRLPNVFLSSETDRYHWISLKTLEYISNWQSTHRTKLFYKDLQRDLGCLGITEGELNLIIGRMSLIDGVKERGLIWLDGDYSIKPSFGIQEPSDDLIVDLLPSGKYFIDILSTSKEYTFWCALVTPFERRLEEYAFPERKTYNEEFQFRLISLMIEKYVLPDFEGEVRNILNGFNPSPDSGLTPAKFYWNNFSMNYFYITSFPRMKISCKDLYPVRLIGTIYRLLERSNMRSENRKRYEERFQELFEKAQQIQEMITSKIPNIQQQN
jgi:Cdc6-like AAA superfamily ATPase